MNPACPYTTDVKRESDRKREKWNKEINLSDRKITHLGDAQ